ncbi:D-alanyl-D-alanine carboxypeptidase [Terasakiella sp. A23]|uniref:D-alanyl-D-alanine carboxypeptidase n=1 Tax=Terasakiella sp. FCG-A23 TaxID=3080561 RepID=UPI0029555AEE|nr:D-alanyl-D-alanine carboxypeptidase [Terasakiella sp. A23]MDV7338564.1 D-alanyl-D-alanine carboxypeptidase [Terasakiella sp. A23]
MMKNFINNASQRTGKKLAIGAVAFMLLMGAGFTSPAVAKYASFVMDADTGRVLHSVNADTRNYPASLTKMMTLFMLFEALEKKQVSLNTKMRVSRRATWQPPSRLGLKRGSHIRVEDAIYALVTKSANDVATVVAEKLGGTEWEFAKAMTKRAKQIGMKSTNFRNASGLPNRRQLSTARDMAVLGNELWKRFPQYYKYFKTQKWTYKGRTYGNHNKLMKKYDGMDGIKTGYIRASGFNLVSSVNRGGHRLIGVVFGGKTSNKRNAIMERILDKAFNKVDPHMMAAYTKKKKVKQAKKTNAIIAKRRSTAWGVQVGAFNTIKKARVQANAAIKRAPSYLTGAKTKVVPLKNGNKKVYRARVVGVEKREAYRACKALKRMKQPCMVFRNKTQVALNKR